MIGVCKVCQFTTKVKDKKKVWYCPDCGQKNIGKGVAK